MRKFIMTVMCMAVFVPLSAAQGGTSRASLPAKHNSADLETVKHERDAKISAITAQVQEIEARYYARQVQQGYIMMGTIEAESKNWLGLPQENAKLVALIKQYVNGPKVPALTPEEMDALDENKREVRLFLNNGKENPAAAKLAERNRQIRLLREPVFELDARYWAWRVAVVKDTTLKELEEHSQHWVGERSYNAKLIEQIRQNLKDGNTKSLTKKEEKKLEEVDKQVRKLLNN